MDFTAEVERSLRVLDGAVALFCSVGGVEPQSETVWRQMDKYGVPRIAFVNKMDRVGADFLNVVQMMKDRLGAHAVPIQMPVGEGDMFSGIIDLVTMKAMMYRESSLGVEWDEMPIPHDMLGRAQAYRTKMLEAISDEDDTLLEKYLEGKEITPRRDRESAPRFLPQGQHYPGALRFVLQEQGRADAAGFRHRLSAVAAGSERRRS